MRYGSRYVRRKNMNNALEITDLCKRFQNFTLNPVSFTLLQASIRPFYITWNSKRFYSYLKDFGLNENQKVKTLSKGMKLKLMIAVALSHETRLLILDEPTSGLDAVSRDELLSILCDYVTAEDRSILISSHITADLEKIADYITYIHRGDIIYSGTKDELLEKYCILKGDAGKLTKEQRRNTLGYSENTTGFEGLYPMTELKSVSVDMITDTPTLDDIILFTDRSAAAAVNTSTGKAR
jgi:ABC-2 type transport system ATP-binding protein